MHETPDTLYDERAEQAAVGAALVNPAAFGEMLDLLKADDFFLLKHGYIWQAIASLHERSEPVDLLTVAGQLKNAGHYADVGGEGYLTELINCTPFSTNYHVYALLVATIARRRRMIRTLADCQQLACRTDKSWPEVSRDVVSRIVSAAGDGVDGTLSHIGELASDHYDRIEYLQSDQAATFGIPTGFNKLDSLLSGLTRTDLIIVAARPGMGKSSFLSTIALNVARAKQRVLFFSLEMKRPQVYDRLAQIETGLNFQSLQARKMNAGEVKRYTEAAGRIATLPMWIDDKPRLTPAHMRGKIERIQHEFGIDLIIVDYLQLMRSDIQFQSKYEEISEISQSLKEIAMAYNIPLLVAAQLNRETEKTSDKRPQLDNLRGSGQIEQDADIVIFLFSEDYYLDDKPEDFNMEVIVGKHRDGPTGVAQMKFLRSTTRFTDDMRHVSLRVM